MAATQQTQNLGPRATVTITGTIRAQTAFFKDLMVFHQDKTKCKFPAVLEAFWNGEIDNAVAFQKIEELMMVDDRIAAHDLLMDSIVQIYDQQKLSVHNALIDIVDSFLAKEFSYLDTIDLVVDFMLDPAR